MKCTHPVTCWRCGDTLAADCVFSPKLVFSRKQALAWFCGIYGSKAMDAMSSCEMQLPCGKCFACQVQKRKDWSVRLAHEASQFEQCCFITLTYKPSRVPVTNAVSFESPDKYFDRQHIFSPDDDLFTYGTSNFAEYQTLSVRDVQLFLKRLRHNLSYVPKNGLVNGRAWARNQRCYYDHVDTPIRYFCVGEYGGKTHRPHYHILIYGWRPSDLVLHKMHNGRPVYRSKQLEHLWTDGYSTVCDVSPYVAKYCARYVTKKFARLTSDWTGKAFVLPEFVLQSVRNGGIGATWFDRFGADACRVGLCTLRVGDKIQRVSIPKYYWSRLRKLKQSLWLDLREERISWIESHPPVDDMLVRIRHETYAVYRFDDERQREFFGSSDDPRKE